MPQPITPEFANSILGYVQVSSLLAKAALDRLSATGKLQKQAADLQPQVVEHMLAIKTITPEEKTAALKLVADHGTTLELLKHAHSHVAKQNQKIAELATKLAKYERPASPEPGDGVTSKEAGAAGATAPGEYNSLTDNRVGHRTSMKKASDMALAKGLNI